MKGFSEKHIKKELVRSGWEVWRGGLIGIELHHDVYPNVRRKYQRLTRLLIRHHDRHYDHLRYLSRVHHGMPDYICFRDGFKFVECKLGYEQLSGVQKKTIALLSSIGFEVEVHRIAFSPTKTRKALVDVETGEKKVLEEQKRLVLRWRKVRNCHG